MLKIFIKSVIVLILCANTLYADAYLPSTSPNVKVLKSEERVQKVQKANNENVITFSEFSNGTKITDQYADRGIIFKGDAPFITGDGSNPTSPVLSGTPTFDGAIEGHFVDPATHEPTTVNHFELDGGYFNQESSTKLSWFNPKGELIRAVRDSKLGIEHFTVDDENIAYFRIEIVSQEDAGYAIDNVSFKKKEVLFNHTFNLDKITHTAGTHIANTFTIYFKDLKAKNGATLKSICSDYTFFVEDKNQNKRNGKELKGACDVNESIQAFKLNFTFTIEESPYNIEDANVSICKGTECKEIEDIQNFSVYGTSFDVTKDGLAFENGDWNKFMFIQNKNKLLIPCFSHPIDGCTQEQIVYIGRMHKLVDSFKEFLSDSDKETAEKDLIGYYDNVKDYKKQGRDGRNFEGGCHGLAVSAIANFNNKDKLLSAWGKDLNSTKTKTEIVSIFQNHWDNRNSESAKPFPKDIHSYNIDNFEDAFFALSKINYYYLSQSIYKGGNAWVGKHNLEELNNITNMNSYHKEFLKNNKVSIFSFDIKEKDKPDGGHSIIATELIKYISAGHLHSIYVLHDNNFPNIFSMLEFDNAFRAVYFIFGKDKLLKYYINKYNKVRKKEDIEKWFKSHTLTTSKFNWDYVLYNPYGGGAFYGFDTFSKETDKLHIYGKANNNQQKRKLRSLQKVNNANATFDYPYPNHISITIIGGKLLKVTDTQTQKEVILNPIIGQLEENKAYLKDNQLITKFLLPKSSIYKIELQKYKQYPAFEVYAKIPTNDGKVEIINYENLATNLDDSTSAHFLVGNGNNDKSIKRDGESDVNPTYDEAIDMKITPATFLKAISLSSGVKLTWNLPDNPNLQEVVVVRKENTKPTSITDGSEIYRGLDETYTDSSAINDREYYYGIYTIAKNGDVTDGQFIYVNTHQATLFGYVKDSSNNPVTGAEVVLKNGVGLVKKVINTETTDKNGYFTFGNLPLGTYLIEFSHPHYTFANNAMTVKLENKNMEVTQEAIGQPELAINTNRVMKVDENETISWDGLNVEDSATVNVKLKRANTWETLASGVEFSKHFINWKVTEPKDENTTLKIELSSDLTVYSEEKVYIFGADEVKYDFDGDGDVDIDDIMKVVSGWNTKLGDTKYNSAYDINKDNKIDIKDIMMIASKWKI